MYDMYSASCTKLENRTLLVVGRDYGNLSRVGERDLDDRWGWMDRCTGVAVLCLQPASCIEVYLVCGVEGALNIKV